MRHESCGVKLTDVASEKSVGKQRLATADLLVKGLKNSPEQ